MNNIELRDYLLEHVKVHARTEESQRQFFSYLGQALEELHRRKTFDRDATSVLGIVAKLVESLGMVGGGRPNVHRAIGKLEVAIWRLQRVQQDYGSIGFVQEDEQKEFLRNLRRASLKPQIDPEDHRIVWVDSWVVQATRAYTQNTFDMPLWQYLRKMKPKPTQL